MLTMVPEDILSNISSIMFRKSEILIYFKIFFGDLLVPNDALGTGDAEVNKQTRIPLSYCLAQCV